MNEPTHLTRQGGVGTLVRVLTQYTRTVTFKTMRTFLITSTLLLATPAIAQDCEAMTRAQMVMVDWPVPMRQTITTSVAGNEFKGTALSTGANRAMYMDADGKRQSLSLDERFYSTADGETWVLVRTYTPEEMQKRADDLATQAKIATEISCEFDIELDGKTVHRLNAKTVLQNGGQEYAVSYWVDAGDGFPWRIETEFIAATITRTTQENEPAPSITLPDPER
ncbi:MAG: hypothetical protein AAGG69_03910 [Pseudomonadota bacterium]